MTNFLQININHCWKAQQLISQTVIEQSIGAVLVSKQLRNPVDDEGWCSSEDDKCAISVQNSSHLAIKDRGGGTDIAWIRTEEMLIYSC